MYKRNNSTKSRAKNALLGLMGIVVSAVGAGLPAVADGTAGDAVLQFSDVTWGPLNPARGEASPRAANLWGDRTQKGATGMLVKFKEGFASPPHIHNVSYRGIVISGLVHNDDPGAEEMWLAPGSFWTQPAGDNHITSANGETNLAYIEIDDGPYLVQPSNNAFDNGETSINVDRSNLIWINASDLTWAAQPGSEAEIAFLWGSPNKDALGGTLVKLPQGFNGHLLSDASEFHAVTIQGQTAIAAPETASWALLLPGSYFGAESPASYDISCTSDDGCILYLRTNDTFTLKTHAPTRGRR